ncbi:MAG: Fic family protein [Bacteroidales bacterium]|nr:Fic family protein [Bacteroidales bacterium]
MYIYQSDNWTKFIWDKDLISNKLLSVNKKAGYLSGRLSALGFDSCLKAMTDTITNDVIDSYQIEGVNLDSDMVRSSVARKLGVELPKHKEPTHYIDGIVEMMLDATANYSKPLTEKRLFIWHCALFPSNKSGINEINVGKYRVTGMKVVSGSWGREKVHYQAPEAEHIPEMMSQFIQWYNSDTKNVTYLKSAIAHLYFISIHPFDDGNGRMARAISDMALSQADNSKMRFFSMSNQINTEKKHYYDILERTQKGNGDITEWLMWYLSCMERAIDKSNDNLSMVVAKSIFWQKHSQVVMSERQKDMLNIWLDGYDGKLTAKNWAKLSKKSLDTALRDIDDLINKQILIPKDGAQRNVEYEINMSNN